MCLQQHGVGEGLEAAFAGHLGARALLLLVGQVEVFELLQLAGLFDGLAQFVGELALGFDSREDFLLTFHEVAQVGEAFLDVADLLVLQRARGFLAVAGDEGYGVAVIEQLDGLFNLIGLYFELFGDGGGNIFCQHIFLSCCFKTVPIIADMCQGRKC